MLKSLAAQHIDLIQDLEQVRPERSGRRLTDRPRLLVIDDSEETRRIVELWGLRCGFDVATAKDAPEAFRLVLEHAYHFILVDLHLPSMSGFDVLKGIRSIQRTLPRPSAQVICLTASEEEKDRCHEAGFDGFLAKPIDRSVLCAILGMTNRHLPRTGQKPEADADISDLIPTYIRNRKKDIRLMKTALADGDYRRVESLAHKIRGSAGNFGFPEMTETGRHLEQAARGKNMISSLTELSRLSACVSRAQALLARNPREADVRRATPQAVESSL